MPRIKVGIIGCGQIAQSVYLKLLARLKNVELIAFAEPNFQRREAASLLVPTALALDSYEQLLEIPKLDAVVICVPNLLHQEITVAALKKGKHVYLDKPLAADLNQGREILEAWQKSNVVAMVGFNYRFNPLYQATKQAIQSGCLGELISVRTVFSAASKIRPTWKLSRKSGGGVLFDLGCHHFDLIRFWFEQEVCEVFAQVRSLKSEGDSYWLELRLENDLLIQCFFSLNAVEEERVEIYGSQGKLMVDHFQSLAVEITPPKLNKLTRLQRIKQRLPTPDKISYALKKLRSPNDEPSYEIAFTHFFQAIKTGKAAIPDFWDGYQNQAIIAAVEESAQTGRMVSLSYLKPERFIN